MMRSSHGRTKGMNENTQLWCAERTRTNPALASSDDRVCGHPGPTPFHAFHLAIGKVEYVADGSWDLVLVMRDTDKAHRLVVTEAVEKSQDHFAAILRERLTRFVQYQQRGILHQGSGKQDEALLAERKVAEAHTSQISKTQTSHPIAGVALLGG